MKLRGSVHDIRHLTSPDRDVMFELMERNYANMRRDRFDTDLNAKQWAIVVRSPITSDIVGFSTQTMLTACIGTESVHALYSGDTVVDRGHWGDPALASAWGNFALELIDRHPPDSLYWFLTSKGFRTYRYLPLFFKSYFPRPDTLTSAWERSVIDCFGRHGGGELFDPPSQIIRAASDKDHAKPEIAEPGLRAATDPHVRFFVERNPGFARGDELCCLAPLTRENFTRAAYRVIGARPPALSTV
jgi:hypothetical protein